MMDLPDFVPELELRVVRTPSSSSEWHGFYVFYGHRARLVPREEGTRSFVRKLNSFRAAEALHILTFANVYFEMASISALQQNLDRLLDQGCIFNNFQFLQCDGEVEMAILGLLKSKCPSLTLEKCLLTFTPALAEALRESASLAALTFEQVTFDAAEMERLALCLCENASVRILIISTTFRGDESMLVFVKHLHGMLHLRSLTLKGNEFGDKGKRALIEVLENEDHCLYELRLAGQPTSLQNYVNFLLWLKKKGGKKTISRSSRKKWIELLARFNNNNEDPPSALYFILCSDPGRLKKL
jgi:hypothetical protein